ncbi:unnamed protein product [Acanthoscelides obtectus]|uniref:Uncharacterized protein n=1 Tax=Acanthoscelides obtectus TaxID=200917 RepID=A0A9P0L8F3_ACAOB|nr:unnamed protein product [Acanthoscelides obtectus]CAK1658426.1 hypothetical protein AOBTE_LOCUS20878 [Acanthoscelides obtectus]
MLSLLLIKPKQITKSRKYVFNIADERSVFTFNYTELILTTVKPASIQQLFNSNTACVRIVLFLVYRVEIGEEREAIDQKITQENDFV